MTGKRVAGTSKGKHVTAMMLHTLRSLANSQAAVIGLERNEANRVHALADKRLAKIRNGIASPTNAGLDFLKRMDHGSD